MLEGLKRIRPCPASIPLKTVAKGLGLFELIKTVVLNFLAIYDVILDAPSPIVFSSNSSAETNITTEHITHIFQLAYTAEIIVAFIIGFAACAELWLGWTLWKGAQKENVSKLKRWWWITITLSATWVLIGIWSLVNGDTAMEFMDGFELVCALYSLWVVHLFLAEIPKNKTTDEPSNHRDEENPTEFVDLDGISQAQLHF